MADAPKINPTDTLRESYPKLNQAIDNANEALRNSEDALDKATQALANSENTQAQLDQIVIEGDSSVEAAQARVDADGNVFTTLKERLDTKETQFANEIGILFDSKINAAGYKRLNGETDDTGRIKRMLSDATALPGRTLIEFPANVEYTVSDTLTLDIAKVCLVGYGTRIISNINDSTKYLLKITSSDDGSVSSPVYQRSLSVRGIAFIGEFVKSGETQTTNVTKGIDFTGVSGTNNKVAHFNFENCVITGFHTNIHFGVNAYMDSFISCNISKSVEVGILQDTEDNGGERLMFINCDITGHQKLAWSLQSGQELHFVGCSFDYNLLKVGEITNGSVYITNSHLEEWHPETAKITLSGSGAFLSISQSKVLIKNDRHPSFTGAKGNFPYVEVNHPNAMFVIRDSHLHGSSDITHFAKGVGTIASYNTHTFNLSPLIVHMGDQSQNNLLMDGSFEQGTIVDDILLTTTVGSTIEISTDRARTGTKSLKITHAAKGQTGNIQLFIPIRQQSRLLSEFYYYIPSPNTGSVNVEYYYANEKKILGPRLAFSTISTKDAWTKYIQPATYYKASPVWAKYLVIKINFFNLDSGTSMYLDDFLVTQM